MSSTEVGPGRVSKNFTIREVGKSSTAVRNGIDNTPTEEVIQRATVLADNVLEKVREHFGIPFAPGSWYRCERLERTLCKDAWVRWCRDRKKRADDKSWAEYFARKSHPKGEAVDIEIPTVDNADLFDWIKANCEFDQLIREGYRSGDPQSGWIHVSYREGENRNQAFDIANP